ncbi:10283_t:CDS:1, partial [Scutellospora calospora]
ILSTWIYFMKRLNGIAKEAKFELPRDHSWRRNSTSDTTSHLDSQSDALSTTNTDDFEDDKDNEDFF